MANRRVDLRRRPKQTMGPKGLRLVSVDGPGVVPGRGDVSSSTAVGAGFGKSDAEMGHLASEHGSRNLRQNQGNDCKRKGEKV